MRGAVAAGPALTGREASKAGSLNVDVVAFDAYGTLIDFTEPHFVATMAEICGDQGLAADAGQVWRAFVRASYQVRAENHRRPVYRRYDEVWAMQFGIVFRQLGLSGDPLAAAAHLKSRLAGASAFPEVPDVLNALRPRYRLALLSNADDDFLMACLERNGLHFDDIVTSERARAIKPDPAIFLHLTDRLGAPPERVLYVGDGPIPDVLGAVRAGLKSAWVNRLGVRRPRGVPKPDLRVRSLTELAGRLAPAAKAQPARRRIPE